MRRTKKITIIENYMQAIRVRLNKIFHRNSSYHNFSEEGALVILFGLEIQSFRYSLYKSIFEQILSYHTY